MQKALFNLFIILLSGIISTNLFAQNKHPYSSQLFQQIQETFLEGSKVSVKKISEFKRGLRERQLEINNNYLKYKASTYSKESNHSLKTLEKS